MGTSASSKGRNSSSPLVPPWADADPAAALPQPEGQRFKGFRTTFGHFVGGGNVDTLRSALGKYARVATGGAQVGPRRFGPAYAAGGGLVDLINELNTGGDGSRATGIDLSGLVGQPIDIAAQEIARALSPENADADRVAVAILEAIAVALPDAEVFDPALLDDDRLTILLVEFLSQTLFQCVTEDADSGWNKAPSERRTIEAEGQLLDLIRTSLDRYLSPVLANARRPLARAQIERLQRQAMEAVWREWEAFE